MFVGTNFVGDENVALAWVQHDLWFGLKSCFIWQGERDLPGCGYIFEQARSAFLQNTDPNPLFFPEREKLPEIEGFDHRVLQYAHSFIAGYYRWLHRNTVDKPAFVEDESSYRKYLLDDWIYYLRREMTSLVSNLEIAESIVRAVALQNTQDGYDAEDRLVELLKARYSGEFMEAWEAQKQELSA